jgi:hypothetical protein
MNLPEWVWMLVSLWLFPGVIVAPIYLLNREPNKRVSFLGQSLGLIGFSVAGLVLAIIWPCLIWKASRDNW